MFSSILLRIICFAAFSLIFISARAQTDSPPQDPQQETIKIRTELVVVDAQVSDKRSREAIRGLKAQDFELFEDGVKQQIEYFSQDKLPLSIVLLVDISPSVRPVIEKIREGALQTLQRLKPEDEVALMVFSSWTELIQDFTKDRQVILNKLGQALEKKGGGTRIHEAIAKAARLMRYASNPNSRRVIIAITDNQGSMSRSRDTLTEDEVKLTVMESGATVYGLIVRSLLNIADAVVFQHPTIQEHYRRTSVNPYAELSGGEMIGAGKDEVNARLGEMFENLRSRYSIGYLPSNQVFNGKFRRIKFTLTPEARKRLGGEIVVNSRQGYYAADRESEELLAEEKTDDVKVESNPPQPSTASDPPANTTETKAPAQIEPSVSDQPKTEKNNPYAHLVMLDVQAMNKKTGTLADNLSKEDFELEVNGGKQEIAHFSRNQLPLSVILLIDVAGRTPYVMSSLRRNVAYWLRRFEADDEISLIAFGLQTAVIQDFTTDRKLTAVKLRDFMENARQKNIGIGWQDRTTAVFQAAEHMDKAANPVGRRVIIVITDDASRSTTAEKNSTAKLLLDSGSVVYAMVTRGDRPSRKNQIVREVAYSAIIGLGNPVFILTNVAMKVGTQIALDAFLQDRSFVQMIQKTGGVLVKADGEDATEKLSLLLDHIHSRYVIGFTPVTTTTSQSFHPVKLKLKPEAQKKTGEAAILTAQGYYARKPEQNVESSRK